MVMSYLTPGLARAFAWMVQTIRPDALLVVLASVVHAEFVTLSLFAVLWRRTADGGSSRSPATPSRCGHAHSASRREVWRPLAAQAARFLSRSRTDSRAGDRREH